MDLRLYLSILRKRRWWVVPTFFIVVLTTALTLLIVGPSYEASSKILLEQRDRGLSGSSGCRRAWQWSWC